VRSVILLVIAIICFVIALLIDAHVAGISGTHEHAWLAGGLAAFAAAHLP
jgi:hypothetical protein